MSNYRPPNHLLTSAELRDKRRAEIEERMRRGLPPKRPKAPSIEEQERIQVEKDAEYGGTCGTCGGSGRTAKCVYYPCGHHHHQDVRPECVCPACNGTDTAPFSEYVHRGQHPASCPWCQATEFDMEEREWKAREGGV